MPENTQCCSTGISASMISHAFILTRFKTFLTYIQAKHAASNAEAMKHKFTLLLQKKTDLLQKLFSKKWGAGQRARASARRLLPHFLEKKFLEQVAFFL